MVFLLTIFNSSGGFVQKKLQLIFVKPRKEGERAEAGSGRRPRNFGKPRHGAATRAMVGGGRRGTGGFFVDEPLPRWMACCSCSSTKIHRAGDANPTKPPCGRHGGVYRGRWSTATSNEHGGNGISAGLWRCYGVEGNKESVFACCEVEDACGGCLARTRTWTSRTKNCCATITPRDNPWLRLSMKRA